MEELLLWLSTIYPMCDGLIEYLQSTLVAFDLAEKDFLLKKGRVSDHIYFIIKGLLRCYYEDEDGTENCCWFMEEGNVIVSVDSFFSRTHTQEPIQAVEKCQLLGIRYDQLQFAYRNYLEFNFHGRVLTEQYYVLSERRARMLRTMQAPERYLYTLKTQPTIVGRVQNKDLASYLGIDQATLSRIKGKFE